MDANAVAVAQVIEDAADRVAMRLLVRLGAWSLAVFTLQTALLIAVLR